jgi:hypothetical protein
MVVFEHVLFLSPYRSLVSLKNPVSWLRSAFKGRSTSRPLYFVKILNFANSLLWETSRCVVNFNPRKIYSRLQCSNWPLHRRLCGHQRRLDTLEKEKSFPAGDRSKFLRCTTCSLVTTLCSHYYKYFIFNNMFFCNEATVNDLSQGQLAQDGKSRTLQVS